MSAIPDVISRSVIAILEQFGEAVYDNSLSKYEYDTALYAHEKLILDLFEQVIDSKNATIFQRDSHIKLLEQATHVQKEEIDNLQNELARCKSIMGNNSTNSGVTRRTTMLTGAIRKQDQDEDSEANGEIDDYGFTISDSAEEPDINSSVNTYNGRKYGTKGSKDSSFQAGGQFGHEGKTLTKNDAEAIISYCQENSIPVYNITRGVSGKGSPKTCYILGMNPSPVVTKYTVYKDKAGNYDYPEGISKNPVAYDVSVYAYIAYLRYECNLPQLKISNLLRDFTGGIIFPSVGTVSKAISMFSEKCKASFSYLEDMALNESVLHTDATYVFINGNHAYIRNLSCDKFAIYYGMTSKSKSALENIATFKEYHGILCHDHEVVMYHFGKDEHGECIVHVIRYCRKNKEDSGNDWSKELIDFFSNCQSFKEELQKIGINKLSEESRKYISEKYDSIINKGFCRSKTQRISMPASES